LISPRVIARNAAIVAALISTFDTGSVVSAIKALGTTLVVECILLLAPASLSGVPSGADRCVFSGIDRCGADGVRKWKRMV